MHELEYKTYIKPIEIKKLLERNINLNKRKISSFSIGKVQICALVSAKMSEIYSAAVASAPKLLL